MLNLFLLQQWHLFAARQWGKVLEEMGKWRKKAEKVPNDLDVQLNSIRQTMESIGQVEGIYARYMENPPVELPKPFSEFPPWKINRKAEEVEGNGIQNAAKSLFTGWFHKAATLVPGNESAAVVEVIN